MTADRHLLFGLLALQNEFIDKRQLVAAFGAWIANNKKPLDAILVEQQALSTDDRSLLSRLVDRHVAARGGDVEASLRSLSSAGSVRDELAGIADSDVKASIAKLRPMELATIAPTVGQSTSAGQRFEIRRPLDQGGLGIVSVAMDKELNREVALKEIRGDRADNQAYRTKFLLEAEVTGGLEHPGIVPVYGLGTGPDGRPYYAMRLIKGDNLLVHIKRFHNEVAEGKESFDGPSLRKLLRRFLDVCHAIDYAHARGVLHRDLKPGNIMLGKYGETLVVDWGLAKPMGVQPKEPSSNDMSSEPVLVPSGSHDGMTMHGSIVGTAAYAPPEQLSGKLEAVSKRSDVYGLGAMLYELLTGQTPAQGETLQAIINASLAGLIKSPRTIQRNVPKPLEAICKRAISRRPEDRYATAAELGHDIERWLDDLPVHAYPEPVTLRAIRWVRKHRHGVTVGVFGLIATVSCAASVLFHAQRREADLLAREKSVLAKEKDALATREHEARIRADQLAQSEREARKRAEMSADLEKQATIKAEKQRQIAEYLARDKTILATKLADEKTKLAISEEENRKKADKLSEFLNSSLQPEDPTRFTGATFYAPKQDWKTYRLVDLLIAEYNRAERELSDLPQAQAAVFDSTGDAMRQLGLFDHAQAYLGSALKVRKKHLPEDHPDLATSLFHIGTYYHERGIFDEAEKCYQKALVITEKLPDSEAKNADIFQDLAWLHYQNRSEDNQSAMEEYFQKAIRIREDLANRAQGDRKKELLRDVAYTLVGQAGALASRRRVISALVVARDAEDRLRDLGMGVHAQALHHIITAFEAGFPLSTRTAKERAINELQQALTLVKENKDTKNAILLGPICFNIASQMADLKQYTAAEPYYQQAFQIMRDSQMFQLPEQSPKVAEYATVMYRNGKKAEAQELWGEYLSGQKTRFTDRHRFYVEAYNAYQKFKELHP